MLYTSCNSFDRPRRFCILTFFDIFDVVDRRLKVESSSTDDIDEDDADDAEEVVEAARKWWNTVVNEHRLKQQTFLT